MPLTRKESNRKYYVKNKERINQRSLADYEKKKVYYKSNFRKYYSMNRDAMIISTNQSREKNRERIRGRSLIRYWPEKTGEEALLAYQVLYDRQEGVCAICHQPEVRLRAGRLMHLSVDHCHKTGKVRGLLCSKHNVGLGYFDDSEEQIKNMLLYLKEEL